MADSRREPLPLRRTARAALGPLAGRTAAAASRLRRPAGAYANPRPPQPRLPHPDATRSRAHMHVLIVIATRSTDRRCAFGRHGTRGCRAQAHLLGVRRLQAAPCRQVAARTPARSCCCHTTSGLAPRRVITCPATHVHGRRTCELVIEGGGCIAPASSCLVHTSRAAPRGALGMVSSAIEGARRCWWPANVAVLPCVYSTGAGFCLPSSNRPRGKWPTCSCPNVTRTPRQWPE